MPSISAGLLVYRRRPGAPHAPTEVLLVHPGGPFWKGKDAGAWSIPKGLVEEGEDPLAAAKRETREELGLRPWETPSTPGESKGEFAALGSVKLKSGKTVRAWAVRGDCDPALVKSNTFPLQWPPKSGKWIDVPEVDEARWFGIDEAREKINPAQIEFLGRLIEAVRDAGR
jgi:predicted NUDIX family NTP pyrophosphohydrolase